MCTFSIGGGGGGLAERAVLLDQLRIERIQRRRMLERQRALLCEVQQLHAKLREPSPRQVVRVFVYIGRLCSWSGDESRAVFLSIEDAPVATILGTLRAFYVYARRLASHYPTHVPAACCVDKAETHLHDIVDLLRFHCAVSAVQLDFEHMLAPNRLRDTFSTSLYDFNHGGCDNDGDDWSLAGDQLMCDFEQTVVLRQIERAMALRVAEAAFDDGGGGGDDDGGDRAVDIAHRTGGVGGSFGACIGVYAALFPLVLRATQGHVKIYAAKRVNVSPARTLSRLVRYANLSA